jgi:hypothetical protein
MNFNPRKSQQLYCTTRKREHVTSHYTLAESKVVRQSEVYKQPLANASGCIQHCSVVTAARSGATGTASAAVAVGTIASANGNQCKDLGGEEATTFASQIRFTELQSVSHNSVKRQHPHVRVDVGPQRRLWQFRPPLALPVAKALPERPDRQIVSVPLYGPHNLNQQDWTHRFSA